MAAITFLTDTGVSALVGTRVAVYRNLHSRFAKHPTPVWSVATVTATGERDRVVGWVDGSTGVVLSDVTTVVKSSRVAAVAAGANREVCAWLVGTLTGNVLSQPPVADDDITFNPHSGRCEFFYRRTGGTFTSGRMVAFARKVWAIA